MNRNDPVAIGFTQSLRPRWQALTAIVLLSLAASASSLGNGFALDDVHIIAANPRVHTLNGWWTLFAQTYWPPEHGASLYRPLTVLMFSLQWTVANGSPLLFHVVSVILYVAISIIVLMLAQRLMPGRAAFFAAAAFAVHPVHVEAVANVVGQAELWAALFVLLALLVYLRGRAGHALRISQMLSICGMYLAALGFKEHAIILPALIVAAETILLVRGDCLLPRVRRIAPLIMGMGAVAFAFLIVRTTVIGQFTGGSTATVLQGQDYAARVFTMLKVFPEWMRLFFWPAELSANYAPPRIETATSFDLSMLPALVAIIALFFVGARIRRDHPGAAYSLAFTGLALLIPSNLVVVTGFVLAERALFLPSVGVVLAIGYAVNAAVRMVPTFGKALLASASAYIVAGVVVSSDRGPVWKDNETLLRQTVIDVPSSYRAHLMLGELLTNTGNYEEGLIELAKAVSLSAPQDVFVRRFAASRFEAAGLVNTAQRYYKEAAAIEGTDSVLVRSVHDADDTEAVAPDSVVTD